MYWHTDVLTCTSRDKSDLSTFIKGSPILNTFSYNLQYDYFEESKFLWRTVIILKIYQKKMYNSNMISVLAPGAYQNNYCAIREIQYYVSIACIHVITEIFFYHLVSWGASSVLARQTLSLINGLHCWALF